MRFLIFATLALMSPAAGAQRVVVSTQSLLVIADRALQDLEPYPVPPSTEYVATDGLNTAWAVHGDSWEVGLLDMHDGIMTTVPTLHRPHGIAMTGDGGAVVTETDGQGQGWLERYDACGSSLWVRQTDPAPKHVTVDRVGQIWVTHGLFNATLTRHSPAGVLLGRMPLEPLPNRLAASPLGYVWTLCSLTHMMYCHTESGDLVLQFAAPPGAHDFAFDRDANLVLLDTVADELQLRGPFGGNPLQVPLTGDASQIAFDANGALWTASSTNGLLSTFDPPGVSPITATVGVGVQMRGDWSGLEYLACAGRARDTDGDGVCNGLELEVHSDPLDADDVPMGLDLLAPATAGAMVPFRVRSAVTPRGLYWLCAAASTAPAGTGPLGLPLTPDWLFDAFQDTWPSVVFSITASLDAAGCDLNQLYLPSGAAGQTFYMAFVALRSVDLAVLPSPATRIDVL